MITSNVVCGEKRSPQPERIHPVSPLRQRMINDMELAGHSLRTQETYIAAVAMLQKHFNQRPDRLSEKQVYGYILWLRDGKGVAKGTFQTHFHGLKFFFYRCLGYEWALFTIKKVAQPRQKRIPYVLPQEDCLRLIGAIRSSSYRLCCSAIYTLGLRISEALSMKVNSIDSKQMIVRIIGKGNKERILPLPESLLRELRSFWLTHHNETWLFPNQKGSNHINRRYFYMAFSKAREAAGLSSDFKPHCLRHCFATHLLASGVEIHVVQMLMGHANIKSTQIYTHQTEAMRDKLRKHLDDIFGKVFPGGQNHE